MSYFDTSEHNHGNIIFYLNTAPTWASMLIHTHTRVLSKEIERRTLKHSGNLKMFHVFFFQLCKVKSYWILFMVFGAGLALFTAFTTFLEQILCPRGYSNVCESCLHDYSHFFSPTAILSQQTCDTPIEKS